MGEKIERISTKTVSVFTEHGKVPPQSVDLEEAVLGALMLESQTLTRIIDFIKPEMFYKESHQKIYQAACNMFDSDEPIDMLTITNELKNMGELEVVGGPYYITMLTSRIASTANIEIHARIILEKYMARTVIDASSQLIKLAFEDTTDVFELLDQFTDSAFRLNSVSSRGNTQLISDVTSEIEEYSTNVREGKIDEIGMQSHIKALNEMINGFRAPDIIVLAGRPGMGKTALLVSLVVGFAESGNPVGIFSLEMSAKQLVYRIASQKTGIPYNKLIMPKKLHTNDFALLKAALKEIGKLPIYIDDTSGVNIREIRAKGKEMRMNGVKMIFVDYMQLMSGGNDKSNRESQISEISRGLKQMAKDLDIPVMPLSQLSRNVENRPGKRPVLADLRESGAIEQDADIVCFMFRPAYYKVTEDPDGNYTPAQMEVLCELEVAKNRNGPIGTVPIKFDKVVMRYSDMEETQTNQTELDIPEEQTDDLPF